MSVSEIEAQVSLLAFEVTIDDLRCITFAPTDKAARCNAVLAAREAGYSRSGTWPTAHVRRIPRFDHHVLNDGIQPRRTWSPEHIEFYP